MSNAYKIQDYRQLIDKLVPVEHQIHDDYRPLNMLQSYPFLLDDAIASLAWSEAYDRGHSAGQLEVESYFRGYCELFSKLPLNPKNSKLLILVDDEPFCLINPEKLGQVETGFHFTEDKMDYLEIKIVGN